MPEPNELLVKVETLQGLLIDAATSSDSTEGDYVTLRDELLNNPAVRAGLPTFVHTCHNPKQFWHFIKRKYATYRERREYIWGEFDPLLKSLEASPSAVLQPTDSQLLARLSPEAVQAVWQRALDRRVSDPEGAITAARALLETVCKHILEDVEVGYEESADLPRLYRLTAETLNIAPSQHTESVFKQILGGCTSVVEGLGALRNKLGDAHGGGIRRVRPAPRHAQLAVNLSGAMTAFLVATWEAWKVGEN